MKKNRTIALVGVNLGTGNLGEEITASALKQNIKQLLPDAHVIHITSNPGDTTLRHNSTCIPIHRAAESRDQGMVDNNFSVIPERSSFEEPQLSSNPVKILIKKIPYAVTVVHALEKLPAQIVEIKDEIGFLRRSYARLENVDQIVIAGSGPLIDFFGGPFSYPYLVAKWTLLAKFRSIPVTVFSVGAVPFSSWLSRFFVKYLLTNANYYSFRDSTSQAIALDLGIKGKGDVYPDIAFSYRAIHSDPGRKNDAAIRKIGISLFPHFDPRYWPEKNADKYNQYVNIMSRFCGWLIQEGYRIVFLSTQIKADILVMNDVIVSLGQQGFSGDDYRFATPDTHEAFMQELDAVDLMVVTRFHGMIMSLLSQTPVIGLANQQKMFDLMCEMEQQDYLLDADNLLFEELKSVFDRAIQSTDDIKKVLQEKCQQNRNDLLQGYRKILQVS